MPHLEFDIWGSIPFDRELTGDPVVQQILLVTRNEPRSISEIVNTVEGNQEHIERRLEELARWDLLVVELNGVERWAANIPVYTTADIEASEEIGGRYAWIEADILRSSLPGLREAYESCEISRLFQWDGMSLIVVGALLADLCVYDRVRFFPHYLCEGFLPPLHPDGSRWQYVAYESRRPRFQRKRWAFCQNLDVGKFETGGIATFSYFDPPAERQPAPRHLFDRRLRGMVFRLANTTMSPEETAAASSLNGREVHELLEDLLSGSPPALSLQDGRYALKIPVLSRSDLTTLLRTADVVAETIHTEVTVPWYEERLKAAKQMGLRFPLAEGYLARDMALQILVEEGRLSGVPEPPVPWNFGVWGWQGRLPLWEDVKPGKEGTQSET